MPTFATTPHQCPRAAARFSTALRRLLYGAAIAATFLLFPTALLRAAPQVIFSDSFSGTLSQWVNVGGAQIVSGRLHVPVSQEQMRSNFGLGAWDDFTFEATVTIENVAAGLVFRSLDNNNYYMWQLNASSGKLRPHKKVGGTFTVIKEVLFAFQANVAYDVKIVTSGATIQTFINGTLIDTTTDTTFALGPIGFRTGSTETFFVDNLSVFRSAPSGLLLNNVGSTSGALVTQTTPQFGWVVNDGPQTAYQILVATSPSLLNDTQANVWNSHQVTSATSLGIPFAGTALASNSTYYWTARTWNSGGIASPFSSAQSFQTATVSGTYKTDPAKVVQNSVAPVQVVQKSTGHYFIDFGRDAFGTVVLTFSAPQNGRVVTVDMGEALSAPSTVNRTPPGTVRFQEKTITMQTGVTSYKVVPTWSGPSTAIPMPPAIGQVAPFRYVEVSNVPDPFTASQINQLSTHLVFDDQQAQFTSSSQVLNDVWNLCKYSIKATTFTGVYVDGDRERTPYEADGYIHALGHYCTDRDLVSARYSHEYLLSHSTWPTEWLMHSVLIAWNDYLYTGDLRSLQANYNTLKNSKMLLSLERSDGLLTGTTTSGSGPQPTDIVDWPAGERDGYDMAQIVKTVVSSFHYRALVLMQQIATTLGNSTDATDFQNRANLALNSLNTELWDSTNHRYIDGMSSTGVRSTHASLHANFFPLAFGVVPAAQQANVVAFIKTRGMACSVYGAQYLLEALYQAGEGDYALSLLTATTARSWANMTYTVGSTITLEAWDPVYKPNLDWNHAWGAAPANIIPRYLMGVRPLTPGFGKILIQPQVGSLTSAQITVPTIRGTVGVNVTGNTSTSFAMAVDIPANTTAKVGVPTLGSGSTTVIVDGAGTLGTITGNTLYVDNVAAGHHTFVRMP